MSTENDAKQLKLCLTKLIELVEETRIKLNSNKEKSRTKTTDDNQPLSSDPDEDACTFTLNEEENQYLDTLVSNVQAVLDEHLRHLSRQSSNYLLDFLHTYHYNRTKKTFSPTPSIDLLYPFQQDLKGLLAALEAFPAAFNGQLDIVKTFIQQYPAYKNKPGLWETTLLYSAARNNHLHLVKYLIEEAHCSVNAQNQRDVAFALGSSTKDYNPKPAAASTPLHAACFNNHLTIVEYLVDHGADYFIHNQAHETPTQNAESRSKIKKFFQDYLVLRYSMDATDRLPTCPIMDEDHRPLRDSIWEYKPFQDTKWYKFSSPEATELHKALLPSEQFQKQVYLKVAKGLYSASMMEFVRSGRHEHDQQKNMAWIRCRGSSILNFDCFPLWQLMIIQYDKSDKIDKDTTPSLNIQHFPGMTDISFKLHLNSWYSCDENVSKSLDEAMNYRRKVISINIPYVADQLKINLETFEFANNDRTLVGYIRWIPKLVSNNDSDEKRIVDVDNYHPMATVEPIPLTSKRLKQMSKLKTNKKEKKKESDMKEEDAENDLGDEDDDTGLDMATIFGVGNDDEGDDDDEDGTEGEAHDQMTTVDILGEWSLTDLNHEYTTSSSVREPAATTSDHKKHREHSDTLDEQLYNQRADDTDTASIVERVNPVLRDQEAAKIADKFESEVKKLKDQIEQEKLKFEQHKQSQQKLSKEKEQQLQRTNEKLAQLQQQLLSRQTQEQQLNNLTKQIKAIDYDTIDNLIIKLYLAPNQNHVIEHLKSKYELDKYFVGIPSLTMTEKPTYYCVSLTGVQAHHEEFRLILRRLQLLSTVVQSAKAFYQRQLDEANRKIVFIMTQQIQTSSNWRFYTRYFQEMTKKKIDEFVRLFDEYISQESKTIIGDCIRQSNFQAKFQVQKLTTRYMAKKQFIPELEFIKYEAFNEFIKQQVFSERTKFDKKPSAKSMQTMNEFIDKVKKELQTNDKYHGFDLEQLRLIPKLLQRIMLYYRCFLLQLPLYESSKELLDKIEKSTVLTIATSTGSGKSSLLPALLIAEGYDKVIVTQPRRLPCTAICERVNQTMMTTQGTFRLAGWAVSGDDNHTDAPILYLTDGLLKERLLHDENLVSDKSKVNKAIVFFIDEVHERSVNIDLCLALIARLLTNKPQLKSKIKIIISSATLDTSVPTLFRKIPQLKFEQFQMASLGTLHHVTKIERPNQNILDLVQELCKKRQRHDQILCFVSSVAEVHQSCRLLSEISRETLVALPLIQSQSAREQQQYIEHGTIFFSTTVAETSLTFPSLTYVIDTGMINIPVYDITLKQTILKEVRAAESTIKQRLGRLGRTKPGEYYALYDYKVEDKKFPIPQICQSELSNVELSLRRSSIKQGLNYIKQFLPDSPSPQAIGVATNELQRLNILDAKENLTSIGMSIAQLPDFGSLSMSKAVLAALDKHHCGRDLIVLSSILGVLNTSSVLKALPDAMKRPEGDFMSLLTVMNEILLVRESVPSNQFRLDKVCQAKGLVNIAHVLKQALNRYKNLERDFKRSPEYQTKAYMSSCHWPSIAKSLLEGYGDNVFVSMKELQGKTHLFTRYSSTTKEDVAVLDLQSTLTRAITAAPVALILARDIRFSSSIRATAVLSFVGEIKSQWIDHSINRKITLNTAEETRLNSNNILASAKQAFPKAQMQLSSQIVVLQGIAGQVLDAELYILRQLIVETKFKLQNPHSSTTSTDYKRVARNLESVAKTSWIFQPMIWRWEAQRQVKITVNTSLVKDECEVTIVGRDSQNQLVQNEFNSFLGWLKMCAVIRHPNAGIPPRILKPQMRKKCLDIEERIARVTDSKRTSIELWKSLKGSKATRETRMEVVAWIAVTQFDCRLEGGFVRDWIVGNYSNRPTTAPSTWITYVKNKAGDMIPYLDKGFIPSDLDCHLPLNRYFDIDKFLDHLHRYQIECEVIREDWRYVLLLDKNTSTGAFTMDLIEPHVALTHDRIDFDVSNLSVEKDYTKELGMRVDIERKPYSIDLEIIVDNIKNKRFQVLRPIDFQVTDRIKKMQSRGWTQLGEPMHVVPDPPPKYHVVLVPLPPSSPLYQLLVQTMKTYLGNQADVKSIEQIRNPLIEDAYLSMKKIIAKQCAGQNPNERELFHGTSGEAIDGILNDGYDDRYWGTKFGKGKFGHGAYFADNPSVSHKYTEADPSNQTRIMYYNRVTLGKESVIQENNPELVSAPKGYHSIHATFAGHPHSDEYIVYRYGQAMPYLRITYTAPIS
ncbi:hypothetical protein I4U23_020290 [Adineta vaga]|nr:hypothetical protein I4U23_020290 [Adineta vaga]